MADDYGGSTIVSAAPAADDGYGGAAVVRRAKPTDTPMVYGQHLAGDYHSRLQGVDAEVGRAFRPPDAEDASNLGLGPIGPVVGRLGHLAQAGLADIAAPFMAAGDLTVGRPAAAVGNAVNDATGLAPGYEVNPQAVTDLASVVIPLAGEANAERAIAQAAAKAGVPVEAYKAMLAEQAANAKIAQAARVPPKPAKAPGVAAPFQAAVSQDAAQAQAGARLANAASDPSAVRASLAEGPQELVPGSQPTTFQQTGDLGIGGLEREARTRNPADYQQRAAEQNAARQASMPAPGGDASDLGAALRGRFDAIDAETEANVNAAAHRAGRAGEGLGPESTPEESGAAIRTAISDAERAGRARTSAMYTQLGLDDPAVTANVRQQKAAAADIEAGIEPTARPPEGEEAAIYAAGKGMKDVAPMRDLLALRSRVGYALRAERAPGGSPAAVARLTRYQRAIDHNLDGSIADAVEAENAAIASGEIQAGDSLASRLTSLFDEFGQQQTEARTANGSGVGPTSIGRASSTVGSDGTAAAPGRGFGGSAGGEGVSPTAGELARAEADIGGLYGRQAPGIYGQIQKLGGMRVRDASGASIAGPDVLGALTDTRIPGVINNRNGLSPEAMAQALAERGAFGARVDDPGAALEEALASAGRGTEGGSTRALQRDDIAADLRAAGVTAFDRQNVAVVKLANYRSEMAALRAEAERYGIPGADTMSLEDLRGDVAERRAIQGDAQAASRSADDAEFDRLSAPRRQQPTVSPEVIPGLRAANAAYKTERQTFGADPVDNVLAQDRNGGYAVLAGEVPKAIFKPGPGGFERVQNAIKAGGDRAQQVIEDYAANSLRRAAVKPDGAIDAAAHARWMKAHTDALRALPEATRARLSEVGEAARALTEAQTNRAAALKAAQRDSLAAKLRVADPADIPNIIGRLFNREDAVTQIKGLVASLRGDPQALAGLRQAVADHITKTFVGNTEAATSGANLIKADAFQTFVRKNSGALKLVFTPEEMGNLHAIAADINRAKRSESAIKLPGQSNTAQDTHPMRAGAPEAAKPFSILDLLATGLGGFIGATHGPIAAAEGSAAGAALSQVVKAMKARGIARVDDLVNRALLDPALARTLLAKAPQSKTWTAEYQAGVTARSRAVERALVAGAAATDDNNSR